MAASGWPTRGLADATRAGSQARPPLAAHTQRTQQTASKAGAKTSFENPRWAQTHPVGRPLWSPRLGEKKGINAQTQRPARRTAYKAAHAPVSACQQATRPGGVGEGCAVTSSSSSRQQKPAISCQRERIARWVGWRLSARPEQPPAYEREKIFEFAFSSCTRATRGRMRATPGRRRHACGLAALPSSRRRSSWGHLVAPSRQ